MEGKRGERKQTREEMSQGCVCASELHVVLTWPPVLALRGASSVAAPPAARRGGPTETVDHCTPAMRPALPHPPMGTRNTSFKEYNNQRVW